MKSKLPGKKAKPPVPKESFGLPGKTYKTPSNAVKTTSLLKQNKTKRLAGMQGQSNFKKRSNSEVLGMAINMASIAGLSKLAAKELAASANRASSARVYARATETSNAAKAGKASTSNARSGKTLSRPANASPTPRTQASKAYQKAHADNPALQRLHKMQYLEEKNAAKALRNSRKLQK